VLLSEKTFKPLVFFQPFLVHCNRYGLQTLRDLGFQTFGNWWDESYDELVNHQRFEAMLRVVLEISNWSLEKINDVYREMMPVLDHNHNHFTKVLPELYNAEITQVKNQIADIIKSRS
jgi:fructosamine-3-kinase